MYMLAIVFSSSSTIHSEKPGIAAVGFIGFHVAPKSTRVKSVLLQVVPSVVFKLPTQKPYTITEPI